tara:strand:- start:2922 stop:4010 length:1089 start_codon:yes stop_codon:yes gene_type:complete
MNNLILNYILKNFIKKFIIIVLIIYCFGVILNLFEEVEFFKNTEVGIVLPLILTSIFVPSLVIKLLPFITFISSLWFMISIRNNKDLLILKIYGFSNLKLFFILAFTSFVLGWLILFFVNPVTSSLAKYYEKTKSNYARDIDHLVNFNKNGLWIKETTDNKERIITASKPFGYEIKDIEIFQLNKNYKLEKKIIAKKGNIKSTDWILEDVKILSLIDGVFNEKKHSIYKIKSIYNHDKITNLFNNSDTLSFLEIMVNFKVLLKKGYNKSFLKQNFHSMMTLPFYLFVMTALAAILTLHTMKYSDNFRFIIIGLLVSSIVYYFKDLSLALGKTDRIPLILSIWTPIITMSLFTLVGVIQINEK